MELFIAAQDIGSMHLGLVENETLTRDETFAVSPEEYLQTIDGFLKKHSVPVSSLTRLLVVPGPGSFTASRVSVTLANTMAFALNIPVICLPNPEKKMLKELCGSFVKADFVEQAFIAPLYDRPPNITQAKP